MNTNIIPDPIAAAEARLATNISYWMEHVNGKAIRVVASNSFAQNGFGKSWAEAVRNFLINNKLETD